MPHLLTEAELAEIAARDKARTPGKWVVKAAYIVRCSDTGEAITIPGAGNRERDNAAFIAACSEDVPNLLYTLEQERAASRACVELLKMLAVKEASDVQP